VDPDATVRLIGAIFAGVPSLPLAAGRHHGPRLFDDRIDGETREQHHQRYTAAPISAHGARVRCPSPFSRPWETKIPIARSVRLTGHFGCVDLPHQGALCAPSPGTSACRSRQPARRRLEIEAGAVLGSCTSYSNDIKGEEVSSRSIYRRRNH
jgi:hypothetical protein